MKEQEKFSVQKIMGSTIAITTAIVCQVSKGTCNCHESTVDLNVPRLL